MVWLILWDGLDTMVFLDTCTCAGMLQDLYINRLCIV